MRVRIFRRRRHADDLKEEIQAHLDQKTEALVASGMPRAEAERTARLGARHPGRDERLRLLIEVCLDLFLQIIGMSPSAK